MRRRLDLSRLDLWVIVVLAVLLGASVREQPVEAQQGSFRSVTLNAAQTGTGTAINAAGRQGLVLYVRGTGTISTGVITVEEADFNPATESEYAGTWSSITTINANTTTGGAQTAYHFTGLAYRYVRARITTNLTGGGNVTVVIAGH